MPRKEIINGILLAILATLIWSFNFIVARGVYKQINPVSLAFFRWSVASVIILPLTFRKIKSQWEIIRLRWFGIFVAALCGISLFNTFVYVAGQYTTAINLALVTTTSSPVISVILARIFLREKVGLIRIIGMALCIVGILFLLSKGNLENILLLQFSKGDVWALIAAFCFSIYNVAVKKKPSTISPSTYLAVCIILGTVLLLPFELWNVSQGKLVDWNATVIFSVLYLGAGASVVSFLLWNISISRLGAGRTALFGNLIPVFSMLEAVLLLGEKLSWAHVISMLLIFIGLIIANFGSKK